MGIENKGHEPLQDRESTPFSVSRAVDAGENYSDNGEYLEVDSQETKDRAETLLEKFGAWISVERAVDLAKADSAAEAQWVKTDLIPRRDTVLKGYKENWDEYKQDVSDGGDWEDYYKVQKSFWEKAGYPLE